MRRNLALVDAETVGRRKAVETKKLAEIAVARHRGTYPDQVHPVTGAAILTQAEIDRIAESTIRFYSAQRLGQAVGSKDHEPRPRTWRERLRGWWR